jgi:hypothetical protein
MIKRPASIPIEATSVAQRVRRPSFASIMLMCVALLLGACGTTAMDEEPAAPTTAAGTTAGDTDDVTEGTEQGEGVETGLPGGEEGATEEGGVETGLPGGEEGAADGAEGISFSEIADNPEQWIGQQVTVRGNLDDLVGQRSFTLTEPGLGADSFLVVAQGADTIPTEEPIFGEQGAGAGEWVQVTGMVQRYDLAAVEEDIGFDLQDDLFAAYTQEDLVIVASSINVIGDQALPGQEEGEAAQVGDQVGDAEDMAGMLTVAQIMEDPEQYIGQQVTITANAEEIIGERAFKLDEDDALAGGIDNDLLVIGAAANEPQFDEGILNEEQVTVTGTLRMFNREQLGADLGYDLDADTFADWEGQPVLVAESVTPAS